MCKEDVIPPTTNMPPWGCGNTTTRACMTGCPADPNGECGGGTAPRGSCNMCECNQKNTTCPTPNWRDAHPCTPGWYPDPLLDVPTSGIPLIPQGFTQPVYVELCVPYGTTPGNYTGTITVTSDQDKTGAVVEVLLEVWPIDIPKLNDSDAFNTAFRFGSDMSSWCAHPPSPPFVHSDSAPLCSITFHCVLSRSTIFYHVPLCSTATLRRPIPREFLNGDMIANIFSLLRPLAFQVRVQHTQPMRAMCMGGLVHLGDSSILHCTFMLAPSLWSQTSSCFQADTTTPGSSRERRTRCDGVCL
jgi:hypothetical protein